MIHELPNSIMTLHQLGVAGGRGKRFEIGAQDLPIVSRFGVPIEFAQTGQDFGLSVSVYERVGHTDGDRVGAIEARRGQSDK